MEIRPLLSALWRSRTGPLLVAVQVAIALTVLVNVAYIIEQRIELARRPTGIDLQNIFWVSSQGYTNDYNQGTAVAADLAWLNALPGVVAAAAIHAVPQTYNTTSLPFAPVPGASEAASTDSLLYMTTARGIDALGLKLIAGRVPLPETVRPPAADMMESFTRWAPEIVITRNLAEKIFPKGDALGKTLYAGIVNKPAKIVGIVDHMQGIPISGPWGEVTERAVFLPGIPPGQNSNYLVRTEKGRRAAVMAQVEKELTDREPGRYIARIQPLDQAAAQTRTWMRASAIILGVVGLLVLAVTAIGIFGLAAFNVAIRTKQIGTRRAIGARKFHILRYFLVENWLVTTSGAIVGCVLAIALGVELSRMFQMARLPLYYIAAGVVALWMLGLAAVLFPARRAASIAPATATRTV